MNENQIKIARQAVKLVAGYCAGSVISSALKNVVPALSKKDKIKLSLGAYTIGVMVSDLAEEHAVKNFDELINTIKKVRNTINGEPTTKEEPQETKLDNE